MNRSVKPLQKKHQRKGASVRRRQDNGWKNPLRWLLKCVLVLTVGSCAVMAVWLVQHTVTDILARPISVVKIEGEFVQLSEQQLLSMVEPMIDDGFLELPLNEVKQQMEKNPWIAVVSVARRWPDQLLISVVEQQPIARWQTQGKEQGFVNRFGEVIKVDIPKQLESLPLLIGDSDKADQVMATYVTLNQLLRPKNLYISELEFDQLQSWQLRFSNNLVLVIGRDNVMGKVQRFITAYEQTLKSRLENISRIDLRYENGLAVAWREPKEAVALGR